jgi:hypothetical protein
MEAFDRVNEMKALVESGEWEISSFTENDQWSDGTGMHSKPTGKQTKTLTIVFDKRVKEVAQSCPDLPFPYTEKPLPY